MDAGLLLFDAVGNTVALNRRQREIMSMAYPDGHGGTPGQTGFVFNADQSRLLEPEELPSTRAAAGEPFEDAVVWIGADPRHRRALSVTARPVRDRTGATVGSAVACTDITDLVRATQVKEYFVAAVSHELRTPLTAALAYLELVEDSADLSDDVRAAARWPCAATSRRLAMLRQRPHLRRPRDHRHARWRTATASTWRRSSARPWRPPRSTRRARTYAWWDVCPRSCR